MGALSMAKNNKTKFIRYPEFGIAMPTNYSIHGIDVFKISAK